MFGTIFVSGASGTIGQKVCDHLVLNSIDFTVGLNTPNTFVTGAQSTTYFDYNDVNQMCRALSGFKKLFFILPFDIHSRQYAANIIDAAKKAEIETVVRTSMVAADPNSVHSIAKFHGEIDQLLEQSGLDYIILRPNILMQNFTRFYKSCIEQQGFFYIPGANSKTSFIDADDVGAIAAKALINSKPYLKKTMVLTGSESLSYQDVSRIMTGHMKREISYMDIEEFNLVEELQKSGIQMDLAQQLLSIYQLCNAGLTSEINQIARDIMEREPISLKEFVRQNFQDTAEVVA
ncbi:MAG: hypothetical protein CMP10_19520 [Zetaproteobacteria bacterium]|nr:hypothetical protein [Pseudobdellovibrionaceae bacterium]|tara:strand:- start:48 stop:920 length:873 start_codon:yes stop_codon:yes gene_type:complete